MSTTKKTNTQNQYAPGSMNQYQSFMNTYSPILQGYAQNPFSNPFFAQNLSQNLAASNKQGMGATRNAMSQFNMTGMGGAPSGARSQLMSQLGRYGSNLNSNAFLNASNNAFGNQWRALGAMQSFQPLATGQNQTQTTGGLGTWLPQVAAMGISALTGGLGGLGMGMMSNLGGGNTAAPNSLTGAQGGFSMPNYFQAPTSAPMMGGGSGPAPAPGMPGMPSYNFQ